MEDEKNQGKNPYGPSSRNQPPCSPDQKSDTRGLKKTDEKQKTGEKVRKTKSCKGEENGIQPADKQAAQENL
jgi:hypothetical protein